LGKIEKFSLGNLQPQRDWGYAGDYVEAMWSMVQHDTPEDFVIATGETRSVREFVEAALIAAGLEPNVERYVTYDLELLRPAEVDVLVGNSSKAKELLGWSPKKNFQSLVELMVENDLKLESVGQ
jgi:GDPmannose 4,6-dehydratase